MVQGYDIFLSHNSSDKPAIRELKQLLVQKQITAWLDEDELQPGRNWVPLLETAMKTSGSAGILVCKDGVGPWEEEETQALLVRAVKIKMPVIPVLLPGDYEPPKLPSFLGMRTYIDMRAGFKPELINRLIWGITGEKPSVQLASKPKIHSDRLPTVKGEFFGRVAELRLLNDAWAGDGMGTSIIQFIAPGGTGKTKLLRHWLDHTDNIDALIAWSFYSQGASEDKQISATPFFSHAFDKLNSTRDLSSFATEEDKGDYLAELLLQQRTVLVLDGLEPLQHAGKGMRGELKDRGIRQLLKNLAGQSNGLCIITTRIAVHELSDRNHVISHDLQNLAPADGVKLLQSLGVQGNDKELGKTVNEYGNHPLALKLLGNLLRLRHAGDVHKRDTLKELVKKDGNKVSQHAFKVMQAYEEWFAGEPELMLLHLLGLFDHPIEQDVLQVLWDEQIPNLTAGIAADDWLEAITTLREKHRLITQHENADGTLSDQLDCHPLIREYFGQQLRDTQPDAWQQAHAILNNYNKPPPQKKQRLTEINNASLPPTFPATWASAWGEDAHGLWMALDYQGVRYVFRWILPGTFWMGSSDDEEGRDDDEDRHRVTLSKGFWLGETAVTQALWQVVKGDNPSHFKGENHPVEEVSWIYIQGFISQLNQFHPALSVRLPWETEWECACRAGTETAFNFGDAVSLEQVNYRGIWKWKADEWGKGAKKATVEVRSYPCNDWGLFEMHGNVWEWCADAWQEHLGGEAVVDPWKNETGAEAGARRVIRGGSWGNFGGGVRSAVRSGLGPGNCNDSLGFRLALGH